jgi:hypothetical protein
MKWKNLFSVCVLLLTTAVAQSATVTYFNYGSAWPFRLGTNEASSPTYAWRTNLDLTGWSTPAATPIGYGSPVPTTVVPAATGTTPSWTVMFMRKTIVVPNPGAVSGLTLSINIDDGYIAWVGTNEIGRYNVVNGEPTIATTAGAAIEPEIHVHTFPNTYLKPGTNIISIQSFNSGTGSSDHYVDALLTGTIDDVAPAIAYQLPFAGSTVQSLSQIEINFSENVTGVNASDLLINGAAATNVTALSGAAYLFKFPPQPNGSVSVQFVAAHGIQDFATPPNVFAGASWSYTVDPNVVVSENVRLNEFVAANVTGLRDEDNEYNDWVEIKNLSASVVTLAGWSLSDDPETPEKWVFPSVVIQPNGYLVVFCSGKDRKPTAPNARLHTNFKLESQGGFIGLYNAGTPRTLISTFTNYPEQRRDYSYGYDSLSQLRYFTPPTPGSNNPNSTITGIVSDTKFSHNRGFYETNFFLTITCATPGVTIRYTLDGKTPTATVGSDYTGPILITNTTVVRAFASKAGFLSSDVDAQTYLYINTVPYQATNGAPPAGWPASWGANVVDYGMDPDIVNNPVWGNTLREDLKSIPTFSIVMNLDDLFGGSGIYANPGQDGPLWERPASIELLNPDGDPGFQINCGIRLRGGFSRDPSNPKHAFRFFFRQEYGASKLDFPFFGPTGAKSFDKFDMRTMQNYSWAFQNDGRMVCVRDVMSRDAQLAMNGISTRGNFYHLYINGLYWGLYNSEERPEAAFAESYLGGDADNYDTIKQLDGYISGATDGNEAAWYRLWQAATNGFASNSNYFRVQGLNTNGTVNTNYENLVDVPNMIDYMLVILYGGNLDAPISAFLGNDSPNNWYGFRDRTGQHGGFRFVSHDAEHTLLNAGEDRTGIVDLNLSGGQYGVINSDWTCGDPLTQAGGAAEAQRRSTPQYVWFRMHQNPEFRLLAADRIFKHCFNNGPLSVNGMRSAFLARSNEIQRAIVCESARWGDAKSATPYTRDTWVSAMNTVSSFINARTAVLISQLQADGLYPSVTPPALNSTSGPVSSGFVFRMTNGNASGTIYYTLDGSDPRLIGGAVAPGAIAYSGPITVNTITTIRTRTFAGGVWSPINEVTLYPPQDLSKLLVTEIMYHPPTVDLTDGDEYEFFELKNTGTNTLGLGGLSFDGITFTFPTGTSLAPGQFYLLARNATAFNSKYPGVTVNGIYTGRLANGGETISLLHPLGAQVFSLTFGDLTPWPVTPDGFNFSLVPVTPNANPDYNDPKNWRASTALGGSPGVDDPARTVPLVLINEVLTHTETGIDFIELHNPSTNLVDIGGWFLTDDPAAPQKYRIADGTLIDPLGYIVFNETQFNATPGTNNSFSFNSHGDDAYLFSGNASTNLTGYDHGFSFDAAADEETFGRYVISTGEALFPAQMTASPGAANVGPRVGPIVINEIHYNPAAPQYEFVELKNISSNAVALFDAAVPTNTWRLNGIGLTFPTNLTLAPGAFILLIPTNAAQFTNQYSVPAGVQILPAYTGNLQDSGERIDLQKPDTTGTNGVGYITIDVVRYNDRAPWPPAADGSGPSLQKRLPSLFGNEPLNWKAAAPTPGSDAVGGVEPVITAQPQSRSVVLGSNAFFSVTVTGTPPFQYVWRFNGANLPGETNSTLLVTAVQSNQAGLYSVNVFNGAGFVTSSNATLVTINPVRFTVNPASTNVSSGSNVTLSATAVGNGSIRFQWRFEGTNIAGATNSTYTITSIGGEQSGNYSVLAIDDVSAAISSNAFVFVLIKPGIMVAPLPITTLQGRTAIFSCIATGGAPLFYRWISNNSAFVVTTEPFLVLTNVQPRTPPTLFRVVVTNIAGTTTAINSTNVTLLVLADNDRDGMADIWEAQYGFNTNSAADATLDLDGDRMNNQDEYIAGTNPTNNLSLLQVVFSATNTAELNFIAQSNISYTVQWQTNPVAAPWNRLTNILAQPGVRTIQVPTGNTPASPEKYFRVVTPLLP